MPARTRKRKASEEDATPEVVPAAKKTSRASCRSQTSSQEQPSKVKRSSKKGTLGDNENPNRTRAIRNTKSTASGMSTAKREIRRKAEELLHLIERQVEDGPSNAGSGITAVASKAAPLRTDVIDLEHEPISKSSNTVYKKTCKHLQNMQETIDEYKRANHATANLTKPTEMSQWEEDSKDITKVDKRAIEIVINTLNGFVLGEKKADYHRSPARPADEVEQAARKWLQTGIPIRQDTWGDAAREALKALSGIAKILS